VIRVRSWTTRDSLPREGGWSARDSLRGEGGRSARDSLPGATPTRAELRLDTIADVYSHRAATARAELLELTVILLIALEIVLAVAGR